MELIDLAGAELVNRAVHGDAGYRRQIDRAGRFGLCVPNGKKMWVTQCAGLYGLLSGL